jgi:hypothetical protein
LVLKEDAKRFTQELLAAYPTVTPREWTERSYVRYLSELDHASVEAVIPDLIRYSVTLPTIADIRRRIAEVELELPNPLEAYHSVFERGERHPLVRYVIDVFGGEYNIRTSEVPSITRSQFLKFFEDLRDESVRRGALPKVVRDLAAGRKQAQESTKPEQPSVWTAIRRRFDELPEDEQKRRVRAARKELLRNGEVSPDWLAQPVIDFAALSAYAIEQGFIEPDTQPEVATG